MSKEFTKKVGHLCLWVARKFRVMDFVMFVCVLAAFAAAIYGQGCRKRESEDLLIRDTEIVVIETEVRDGDALNHAPLHPASVPIPVLKKTFNQMDLEQLKEEGFLDHIPTCTSEACSSDSEYEDEGEEGQKGEEVERYDADHQGEYE